MDERLRGRVVEVEVAEDLPIISIDAVLIGQALMNLLDNAVKFSPPETLIHIPA